MYEPSEHTTFAGHGFEWPSRQSCRRQARRIGEPVRYSLSAHEDRGAAPVGGLERLEVIMSKQSARRLPGPGGRDAAGIASGCSKHSNEP